VDGVARQGEIIWRHDLRERAILRVNHLGLEGYGGATASLKAGPLSKVPPRDRGRGSAVDADKKREAPVEERGLLVSVNAAWFRSCRAIPAMFVPPSSMA
jgi:hypothetical protein